MRLKNKALLAGVGAALLFTGSAQAKLHLNPFHHKHKAVEDNALPAEPTTVPALPTEAAPVPDTTSQYDEVGYAAAGEGDGVSASHASLPAPSFVEITNLDTGRTILAVVRTTNAYGSALVGLSPQALSLLGGDNSARIPVRVRRVNPPEQEKAALLGGQKAGDRRDTPAMLLGPLKRKLAGVQGQSAAVAQRPIVAPTPKPSVQPPEVSPSSGRFVVEEAGQPARSVATTAPHRGAPKWSKPVPIKEDAPAQAAQSGYYLQIVSLSSEANATIAARKLGTGASVVQAGKYWRVRMGPFPSKVEARAKLGGLAAKGYGGVKITH